MELLAPNPSRKHASEQEALGAFATAVRALFRRNYRATAGEESKEERILG